jgi:hypothetical protein
LFEIHWTVVRVLDNEVSARLREFFMIRKSVRCFAVLLLGVIAGSACAQKADLKFLNNNQPVLDAHNCYPYEGHWNNRVYRALSSGFPVSIEQDLAWYVDPATGKGRVVVSHTPKPTGQEPTLREYFFEQVRPTIEKAIQENKKDTWPLVVLHFDFKDNQPALLHAVWDLLNEYQPWLSTAVQTDDPHKLSKIDRKPILAITEESDAQAKVFNDAVPVGGKLLLFGSAHSVEAPTGMTAAQRMHWQATAAPEAMLTERPTNYRRWSNNSWFAVEEGGQHKAGDWTSADQARLKALVDHAHSLGYWIRFYTIDGFDPAEPNEKNGWGQGYNFGSLDAGVLRMKGAIAAGVNFIATDQYEVLAPLLKQNSKSLRPASTNFSAK